MDITLYSKDNCLQCDATVMTMNDKELIYEVVKMDKDREALEFVKSLGYLSAPVVVLRKEGKLVTSWSGFRPDHIDEI